MKHIGIIGSGITALATAWQHKQSGDICTVFESSNRIGGAIQSFRQGDYLAEEGPNSLQVNSAEVDAFLDSVPGLKERVIEADPAAKKRFIVRGGKLHAVPMGPLSAITTPLWSLGGKLRLLKEPFIKPIDAELEESAADFVRRRLGEELYEYAINPLIGGIYAGDPEKLSLRYAFPKLYALEQNSGGLIRGALDKMRTARRSDTPKINKRIISFKDGLGELPQLLASALGDSVRTNIHLESIEPDRTGWTIQHRGKKEFFDQLIVTVPAHVLSQLPFSPEIIEAFAPLQKIDYPPVSVLSLAFKRRDVAHPIDGFGALVPECEKHRILGVLFPSSIFPNRAPKDEVLLTVFIGGERQPELATSDTEKLQTMVLEELRPPLGVNGEPTFSHHRHWPLAIPQYKLGYGEILQQIDEIEKRFPHLKLAGNYRTGISLTYCIESSLRRLTP
jgi:oxygen-dependent protoporphyrinogen oxidase